MQVGVGGFEFALEEKGVDEVGGVELDGVFPMMWLDLAAGVSTNWISYASCRVQGGRYISIREVAWMSATVKLSPPSC